MLFLETIGSNTAMNTSTNYVDYLTLSEAYRPSASIVHRFWGYANDTPNYWLLRITANDGKLALVNYNGVQHPGIEFILTYI